MDATERTGLFNAEKQQPRDTGSSNGLVSRSSATAYTQKEFLSSHCETRGHRSCAHDPDCYERQQMGWLPECEDKAHVPW